MVLFFRGHTCRCKSNSGRQVVVSVCALFYFLFPGAQWVCAFGVWACVRLMSSLFAWRGGDRPYGP